MGAGELGAFVLEAPHGRLPLNTGKVITLVGIRRSGKTYLLYDTMHRLEAQGIDRRQMIFLNFEVDRLMPN